MTSYENFEAKNYLTSDTNKERVLLWIIFLKKLDRTNFFFFFCPTSHRPFISPLMLDILYKLLSVKVPFKILSTWLQIFQFSSDTCHFEVSTPLKYSSKIFLKWKISSRHCKLFLQKFSWRYWLLSYFFYS